MKLNKNHIQTFVFMLVYLFAVYFWSQPYQERKLPYGEFDAMSHFEVGDWMAYNDKSLVRLPHYIDLRYGNDNLFKPHTLWYPPPFHTALGIMEVAGGERIVPIFLLNTIMATFVIITTYFVINSLFGFLPAILSSLLIIFSPRDFMPYLWGQWPERFAYAFIPIILYCFYQYFISYSKEKSKPLYLYLTAVFLGISLLVHPLSLFHSGLGIAALYLFLSIKQKKLVFNWRHIAVSFVIFLALFLLFPYQTFNIFPRLGTKTDAEQSVEKAPIESIDISRIFKWSLDPNDYVGSVPSSYFSYKEMHGLWTLPFLLFGILFLLFRRQERDMLLLAWLASLYLVLHRDLIGKAAFLHRSLSATQHIFAPLTAVGAVYAGSFFKLPSNYNRYLKYAVVFAFAYFVFSVNMAGASQILNKEVYNPYNQNGFLTSINQEEAQASQWVLENVPQEYNLSVLGIPHTDDFISATAKKIRWMAAVSQHVNRFYYLMSNKEEVLKSPDWYIMVDYTTLLPLQDREPFKSMLNDALEFEKNALVNRTLVYNKNNIRVYKP
ncbi:hypothetical protein HYY71_03935 [Candidatus Woesearchaeota archaeon]|nr:hypothetical protein [Candidatus Woesearchaeota archaeon]